MIAAHVSRRYARALLELGTEGGNLDALVDEVSRMAAAWNDSADLRAVVETPTVGVDVKKSILREVTEKLALGPVTSSTVMLLTDRRRLRLIGEIAHFLR